MNTPTNSHQKKSRSTILCENPCSSISELLADVVLHPELMTEILLRLPVKSLLKFKCVSKSWLSLISSQQFIKSHLSTSKSRAADVNSQVLFTPIIPDGVIKQFTLYSALYEPSPDVSDNVIPNRDPRQFQIIVGIVNGLVCVIGYDGSFLWNPVLRKSKLLPDPYINHTLSKNVAVGFGYNESNDDYKMVLVDSVKRSPSDDETVFMVYSRLTDSWTRIEECKPGLTYGCGIYANGKIYWTRGSLVHEWRIVSLDMASENYGELQLPDYGVGVSNWVLRLSGDQLVVLYDYGNKKADLWVMDKYGAHVSWSKVVSIPYHNVHPAMSYLLPRVICILRNGVVVLSAETDLLVYDSERKEFRNVELGGSEMLDFHVYVESLVSPNGSGL